MDYRKLDHGLLAILDLVAMEEPRTQFNTYAKVLAIGAGPDSSGPLVVVVFLRCDNDTAIREAAKVGALIGAGSGWIRTATVPVALLGPLSDIEGVSKITAARYLRPQLDQALPKSGIPAFRTTSGLTGVGVVIGVVDSGIDLMRPAFTSRVHSIWDHTQAGPGVKEGGFGRELTGAQMFSSEDETGHGTHVAGIAAGQDPTYGGVAPGATLVIVKTPPIDARISDAILYIFRKAEELGMPAVINLSVGGHWDPHDGSDDLCSLVDQSVGPGRIICAAAGNDGIQDIHARCEIAPGAAAEILFRVPPLTINIVTINMWYTVAAALEFSVQTPNDFVTPWQQQIAQLSPTDNPQRQYNLPEGRVRLTSAAPASDRDGSATVELTPRKYGDAVAHGLWRVRLRNTGSTAATVDAWVIDDFGQDVVFSGPTVQNSAKIGAPGAAGQAITVAAYTSKVAWTDEAGEARGVGLALDDISEFSSVGPLRNGSRKPDVAAPGAMIVSVRSTHSQASVESVVSPGWVVRAGTSMATPVVTGIVALMLQENPAMTPAEVRASLIDHCRIPGRVAGTHDPKWGYGLVRL
jgi:subtilisin family serine protease